MSEPRFDCRTAECQLWPVGLEVTRVDRSGQSSPPEEPAAEVQAGVVPPPPDCRPKRGIRNRPVLEQGVNWLKQWIARFADLESVKQDVLGRDGDRLRRRLFRMFGRQFLLRLLKLRILTPYVLRVEYVVVGGDADALAVTESGVYENSYAWDTETEITREQVGTQRISVAGADPAAFAVNTFGFQ